VHYTELSKTIKYKQEKSQKYVIHSIFKFWVIDTVWLLSPNKSSRNV